MRLHHLEVTAFGPFSGTETVDFDALGDGGLFLLCGPTGSGKTSVLDAVCFGLYGEVPGARNAAKRLRSDHAAPGVAPSVTLEVSVNGRRFRLRRSPAWQRPKQRGTGTTLQQARVTLEEHRDDGWVHLSSRLDETGHLMTDLLGMNVSQFTQVAMLPQGRFQSFLRAKSDERHKVLQQLFRTHRFEEIERWLVTHRQSLKATNKDHQDAVASVVSRLSEASAADLPEDWDLQELAAPAESGAVAAWVSGLRAAADQDSTAAGRALTDATAALTAARAGRDAGRTRVDLRNRQAKALGDRTALEASAEEAERVRERIDAARRAAAVLPLHRIATQAEEAVDRAEAALAEALAEAARLLGPAPATAPTPAPTLGLTPEALEAAEKTAKEAAAVARAFLPKEADLAAARRALAEAEKSIVTLTGTTAGLAERVTALPGEIAVLRTLVADQTTLAAGLLGAQEAVDRVTAQREAAAQAEVLRTATETARSEHRASVDHAQALREQLHDVREARITGMAAELATALASGHSCPVCGSAEHPSPAIPVDGAPSKADEEAARQRYEDADFVRQARAEALAAAEQNLALAVQASAGHTTEELDATLPALRDRVAACRDAGREQERAQADLVAREDELAVARRRLEEATAAMVRLEEQRDHQRTVVERVSNELAALFSGEQHLAGDVAGGVQALIAARSRAGAAFEAARRAFETRDTARSRADEAHQQAHTCAVEHGFDTAAAGLAVALDPGDVAALEEQLRGRAELRARVDAVLTDPAVLDAVAGPAPDLDALAAAVAEAEQAHADAGARTRVALARAARLAGLEEELAGELAAWAPTRAAYAVAHTVSTFAEGKGGDNTLQMRLSAYVLAARLRQVVAAANERLTGMSDRRYTLEHTATRGVGELRGGLSLQVRDEWTGESRDPATLSGGETFIVSLALALGLADVVTQEAGGSNIDTLFIDEGFGTLDPDTLDDVMNTLDALRDGGRVVGIVSHVPEMRTRIPAQLQIRKDRGGSHVVAAREAV